MLKRVEKFYKFPHFTHIPESLFFQFFLLSIYHWYFQYVSYYTLYHIIPYHPYCHLFSYIHCFPNFLFSPLIFQYYLFSKFSHSLVFFFPLIPWYYLYLLFPRIHPGIPQHPRELCSLKVAISNIPECIFFPNVTFSSFYQIYVIHIFPFPC